MPISSNAESVSGRLTPLFDENFARSRELGAAVSVWKDGKPILDLSGGFRDAHRQHPWVFNTIVLFWSATKGIGSACLLHALQEHEIGLKEPVAKFWPEFAEAGKENITLAQLLSHQGGLCALDERVDILDYAQSFPSPSDPRCCPATAGAERSR